jgi:hypothetical protein
VHLNLKNPSVVAQPYIEEAKEPTVRSRLRGICCQWCLAVTESIVVDAKVDGDALVSTSVVAEAVVAEALTLALAGERCLWLDVAMLVLPFLV